MHIITISRQFGSGGRELGKRLADHLEWDYYDKEIIETLADEHGLDEAYVKHMLSKMALTLWRSMLTGIYPERASLVVMSSRGCSTMQSTTSLIASLCGK